MNEEFHLIGQAWERLCPYCGVLINKEDQGLYTEKRFIEDVSIAVFARIWHKACWDKHLEEGEKTD